MDFHDNKYTNCVSGHLLKPVIRYVSKQGTIMHEVVGKRCINCETFIPTEELNELERTNKPLESPEKG